MAQAAGVAATDWRAPLGKASEFGLLLVSLGRQMVTTSPLVTTGSTEDVSVFILRIRKQRFKEWGWDEQHVYQSYVLFTSRFCLIPTTILRYFIVIVVFTILITQLRELMLSTAEWPSKSMQLIYDFKSQNLFHFSHISMTSACKEEVRGQL